MDPSRNLPALFDFAPYKLQREETLECIRQFASHPAFRSAVVEELELDEDFYRRPLRPEDLAFLKFQKPVSAETVSRLPALATNRLLLTLNELNITRLPDSDDAAEHLRFRQFYDDSNQVLGARIRPFLENYAFTYVGQEGMDGTQADYLARIDTLVQQEGAHWESVFRTLTSNEYLLPGLRFIMIQRWSLAWSRGAALARAAASGAFGLLAPADWPSCNGVSTDAALLEGTAAALGVGRRPHTYWQFYLPTSLAKLNLLYALGSRPDRALALLGAAFVAEAESLAFTQALLKACPHLARVDGVQAIDPQAALVDLRRRYSRALGAARERYGASGAAQVDQGTGAALKLAARARWDLGEQLSWLSSIERYCAWASLIEQRIQAECPDIDRETFVEPREMCSTTHVHNDHRLVVIESGDMIFWGNAGMQLQMTVGDKVLIPDGRLHGSTVVSHECTYHQPIIPDAWIAELLAGQLPGSGQAAAPQAHATATLT